MTAATPSDGARPERLGTLRSIVHVFTSHRTAAVALQSFFSGMPLGLIWIAIPAWLAQAGVDIKTIGILTLAQTPWTFKFLWSPLMDRYTPPLMGRKRGWVVIAQIALLVLILVLAAAAVSPERGWAGLPWVWVVGVLALTIAFASTVQDIAMDAYAVEILLPEEQGAAVGARVAFYRAAMYIAGALAITVAASWSWSVTLAVLGVTFIPGIAITIWSPEVESPPPAPASLRAAVWEPLVELLARNRALEIAAFLFLYKFGDNIAQALLRPFLVQHGYGAVDVGIATGTIGLVFTLGGTFIGGLITTRIGLGHALWIFGFLQAISNLGYVWIASIPVSSPSMYVAMGFETFTQGLGTGAFGVLLLRLTEKRFSATQYALLSSIFALGRVLTGPIAGFLVDAMGWRLFFILTIPASAPGLLFLQRFVPLGSAEPVIAPEKRPERPPAGRAVLIRRGVAGLLGGLLVAALVAGSLQAVKDYRSQP
ncbi:MAG TPA: MFS transporter, partial [Candidatus Saccharimonadales bacterium]|nr:MFS transporter [Candidatus Saccharimonadales bacterium]